MGPQIERARKLARTLESTQKYVDGNLRDEIVRTIDELVRSAEADEERLKAAKLALEYYRDPELYLDPQHDEGQEVLDGGNRARTALSIIQASEHRLKHLTA